MRRDEMPPAKSPTPYRTAASSPRTTVTPQRYRPATRAGYGLVRVSCCDVQIAGAEARLGVGEVERPHPPERLVEAEVGHLGRAPPRTSPASGAASRRSAGRSCSGREIAQVGVLARASRSIASTDGELPAGEDVLADPGVGVLGGEHRVVVLQDRLQPDPAARREQPVDGARSTRPSGCADRLDHLDADDGVVLAARPRGSPAAARPTRSAKPGRARSGRARARPARSRSSAGDLRAAPGGAGSRARPSPSRSRAAGCRRGPRRRRAAGRSCGVARPRGRRRAAVGSPSKSADE